MDSDSDRGCLRQKCFTLDPVNKELELSVTSSTGTVRVESIREGPPPVSNRVTRTEERQESEGGVTDHSNLTLTSGDSGGDPSFENPPLCTRDQKNTLRSRLRSTFLFGPRNTSTGSPSVSVYGIRSKNQGSQYFHYRTRGEENDELKERINQVENSSLLPTIKNGIRRYWEFKRESQISKSDLVGPLVKIVTVLLYDLDLSQKSSETLVRGGKVTLFHSTLS